MKRLIDHFLGMGIRNLERLGRNFFMKDIKVIEIPDTTRIIINIGYSSDPRDYNEMTSRIKAGDKVLITEKGIDIKDINGKFLGQYAPFKEELTITEVYEKFSVARKKIVKEKNPLGDLKLLKTIQTTSFEQLNVDNEEVKTADNLDYVIRIGDIVKVIDNKNY